MLRFAVLPPEYVGTYSCHGLDSHHDKINQDAACVCYPLAGGPHAALFLVVDGHGTLGHDVTDEVVSCLTERVERTDWARCSDAEASEHLAVAFEETQSRLHDHRRADGARPAEESGACALLLALRRARLTVAHVGDCRAVLGTYAAGAEGSERVLTATALTVDHTPADASELARLQACGAYIQPAQESEEYGVEPARVYCTTPRGGKGRGPGLAMSRSLGDFDAVNAGVVATPTVSHRALTADDAFLVLATDGIWEFLSSDEVVSVVAAFLERGEPANAAARYLIAKAALAWRANEDLYRDDITAIVIYLKDLLPIL